MYMYKCKKCEKQYSECVQFCAECGSEVVAVRVCDECGTVLPEGATSCMNCGAPVEEAAAAQADRVCGECGASLPEGATVCKNCGAPAEEASAAQVDRFCAECGAAIPSGTAVCRNCGAPVGLSVPVAAASAVPKRKTGFLIGNIIFLLTLIPATVILLGDIFVFKATGVLDESFGYFGFSKTFNYLTDLIGILESFGVDSLDYIRTLTGVFGFTWTVVVIALIGVAIEYVKGIAAANKGRLLDKLCFMPLTYLAISFLFGVIIYAVLLVPINDVLDGGIVGAINQFVGFELSIGMAAPAIWLACIALLNAVVYIILKLAEKLGSHAD